MNDGRNMQESDGNGNVRLERQVRRYDCVTISDVTGVGCHGDMDEDLEFGEWVKWDEVKPLLERLRELEEKVKHAEAKNGCLTPEGMRTAAERERRRLVPIVYKWAFPNSKSGQHEEDMKELAEVMGVEGGNWDRERSHIAKAMELMRDSGASEREYVVYATLSAALG